MAYSREQYLRIKQGLEPKTTGAKPRKPIPRQSPQKKEQIAKEKEAGGSGKSDLQKWYQKIMDSEMPKCWETGEKLNKRDKLGWHGSVSHILPKVHFPSVATHPENYLILSMWNGSHATYDSSWERAAKMKVWKYALKVITKTLYPLLTPEEKRKLPDVILQEIDPLKK